MGEGIWRRTDGRIDGFVQSVGSAAAVRGVGEGLRRHDDHMILSPPQVITRAQIDELIDKARRSLDATARQFDLV